MEVEGYRGRAPLRRRAHDRRAAAGRGGPPAPAPAGLKGGKGTGYLQAQTHLARNSKPSIRRKNRSSTHSCCRQRARLPRREPNPRRRAPSRTLPARGGWRRRCSPHLPRLPVARRLISASLLQRLMLRSCLLFLIFYGHVTAYPQRRGAPRGRGPAPTGCWQASSAMLGPLTEGCGSRTNLRGRLIRSFIKGRGGANRGAAFRPAHLQITFIKNYSN